MSRAAMQQALNELEIGRGFRAVEVIRKALAEPEQPVAYCTLEQLASLRLMVPSGDKIPLYTAPTPRKPLTDEEIGLLTTDARWSDMESPGLLTFARAIERAHGIKEQERE